MHFERFLSTSLKEEVLWKQNWPVHGKNNSLAWRAKTHAAVHQLQTLHHMKLYNCARTTFRLASCSFRALSSRRLAMTASSVFFFLNLFTFSSVSGELLFLWRNMDIWELVLENKESLRDWKQFQICSKGWNINRFRPNNTECVFKTNRVTPGPFENGKQAKMWLWKM